jgi:hypothetical protein
MIQAAGLGRTHVLMQSVRGASHLRSGAPNQDFGAAVTLDSGSGAVLAVADGHGDRLHARSDRGSRFAVESAVRIIMPWLTTSAALSESAARRSVAALPGQLLAAWRERVQDDFAHEPPLSREVATAGASQRREIELSPEILYGSTLVIAAVDERLGLFVQIGDGDILSTDAQDRVLRLASGRRDLPRNVTESLCQPDADRRFRVELVFYPPGIGPRLVMLSTDGLANSFDDDAAFMSVARDLTKLLQREGPDHFAGQIEGWLSETSRVGSGDDITLALLWRPGDGSDH